jgi:hypothetical protein
MPDAAPEMMATLPANLMTVSPLFPWADCPTRRKLGFLGHRNLEQVIAEKITAA